MLLEQINTWVINTHYETALIHHISHSWRNARNNNIMITAGRNGPSESCQIFLNIGGVVFSFAYTLRTTFTVWNQNYAFPLNHTGFLSIDVLCWLDFNISVQLYFYWFWKGHNLNPSHLAPTHNENSSGTFFEELHEGFDLQPGIKQRKRTEITEFSFARFMKTSPNRFHQVTSFKRLYGFKKISFFLFCKKADFSYKHIKHSYKHKQEK